MRTQIGLCDKRTAGHRQALKIRRLELNETSGKKWEENEESRLMSVMRVDGYLEVKNLTQSLGMTLVNLENYEEYLHEKNPSTETRVKSSESSTHSEKEKNDESRLTSLGGRWLVPKTDERR